MILSERKKEERERPMESNGPLDIAEKGSELGKDWFGNLIRKDVHSPEEKKSLKREKH